jgi:hypothetical protein
MFKKIVTILAAAFISASSIAQDVDLFKMLDEESKESDKNRTDYTTATFKTTRLVNGHTVETVGKGILDFKISHRFGKINAGAYEFFGLDNATMRMAFDYGITDRLMVGVGRSTFEKQYDGFLKYKILRQSTGKKVMPVTVTGVASMMVKTIKNADESVKRNFSDNLFYAYQLVVGRKFSERTSFQIAPTLVHHNIVPLATDPNDQFAIGLGGRQKISKRVSINAEYYYVFDKYKLPGTHNSLSVGVDIETGGHVFQLHFTNSQGMTERTFISETNGQWGDGDIFFGFNISRVFTIGKKKKQS